MDKVIDVRYYGCQSAEDLYMTTDGSRRVYVRQPSNVDNLVFWHTSSKWQGGYEADCPIRAGITMRVVDKHDNALFEETLREDTWNSGTSAEKKGPFSYEAIKELATNFEKGRGLKPYEAWRDFVLQDKEAFNNTDYNDTWMYWHVESLEKKVLGKAEFLGEQYCFVEEKMRHKISGREWTSYELMDEKQEITLALCGYEFEKERVADLNRLMKGDEVTIKWKEPGFTPYAYATTEYDGKTRDGKYKFKSITYGWTFLVDIKNDNVITPSGKVYELDHTAGWLDRLKVESKRCKSLDGAIKSARSLMKPEGECKGHKVPER